MVSNAGCADKVLAHVFKYLKEFQNKGGDVDISPLAKHSLVALQGPKASQILGSLIGSDFSNVNFMTSCEREFQNSPMYITRCGYTGEVFLTN